MLISTNKANLRKYSTKNIFIYLHKQLLRVVYKANCLINLRIKKFFQSLPYNKTNPRFQTSERCLGDNVTI